MGDKGSGALFNTPHYKLSEVVIKSKNTTELVTTVSVVTFGFDALRRVIATFDAERQKMCVTTQSVVTSGFLTL